MKKVLALIIAFVLVLGLTACGGSDGKAGKDDSDYEIAVVVKLEGIDYFNVFEDGVKRFADETGINAYVTGPSTADADEQVRIIQECIDKDVDAIVVVPNDADAVGKVLKKAQEKGIVTVTTESPDQVGADYDVEMIINDTFADLIAEDAATHCGGAGQYALYVGSLTVPLHNAWADEVEKYLAENYPDMELVTDRIACGEDSALAREKTLELFETYDKLNCFICFGSQGPLGAAEAITEEGISGITIVGNIIPSEAADYLESGAITSGYLWNPADSGYAACYIAQTLLNGGTITANYVIPTIEGNIDIQGTNLWINNPIVIKADNWFEFGF